MRSIHAVILAATLAAPASADDSRHLQRLEVLADRADAAERIYFDVLDQASLPIPPGTLEKFIHRDALAARKHAVPADRQGYRDYATRIESLSADYAVLASEFLLTGDQRRKALCEGSASMWRERAAAVRKCVENAIEKETKLQAGGQLIPAFAHDPSLEKTPEFWRHFNPELWIFKQIVALPILAWVGFFAVLWGLSRIRRIEGPDQRQKRNERERRRAQALPPSKPNIR